MSTKETEMAKTATDTYRERCLEAHRLIASIEDALDAHAKQGAKSPSWGYAGDLGALNCALRDALAALDINALKKHDREGATR